jgi:hypothetical protein
MIDVWNSLVPDLFGLSHLTMNCHLSTHFVKYVRLFGPLHGYSAFNFEGYNGQFMRLTNTTKGSLMQISKRFAQMKSSTNSTHLFHDSAAHIDTIKTIEDGATYEFNQNELSALYEFNPRLPFKNVESYKRLQVNNVVYHSTSHTAKFSNKCSYHCVLSLNNDNVYARAERFFVIDGVYYLMYRPYEKIHGLLDDMIPPTNAELRTLFNERAYGNFFTYVALKPGLKVCEARAIVKKAIVIPDEKKLIFTPVAHKFEHN